VKGVLEAFAARLACERLSAVELKTLREIHERMRRLAAARTKTSAAYSSAIQNSISAKRRLRQRETRRVYPLAPEPDTPLQFIYLSVLSHLETSMKEHERILAALQNVTGHRWNASCARTAMRQEGALCVHRASGGRKHAHASHGS